MVGATALLLAPTFAQAAKVELPSGGSVAAGSASIGTPHNGTLDINQSSNRAVLDWHSFSVGQGGTVNFHQPGASSATLNRVTGNTPSSIAGTINAPGTVLLVNPNGIAITKDGVLNTGSFAASTLDIKNSDFMSGNYTFTGNGNSAAVTNAGRINVSDGGFAALLGGQVANDGTITARLGRVALGNGELITLDLSGDGFLSVAVPTKDLGKIKDADGKTLITNRGKIIADGGVVELKAATAAGILRDAVNVPGSIRANSVGLRNGKIVLGGGAGGRVRVSGRVRANGRHRRNGGAIAVTGADIDISGKLAARGGRKGAGGTAIIAADQVTLDKTARLNVSGVSGGTLLIGGDVHGGADPSVDFSITPVANAFTATIAAGTVLKADGTNGDGGNIVVWSNDHTAFAGQLSVAGAGGHGGFAEVSSHRLLDFTGSVDLAGSVGAGTLLLDPRNVVISSGSDLGGAIVSGTYTPSADDSILDVTTLELALASGNVIVTTGSSGSQAGDINVVGAVKWSTHSLTLDANHSINVNAAMSASGAAGLTLTTNDGGSGGQLVINSNIAFASTSEALTINGNSYTLENSFGNLKSDINSNSGNGYYALTSNIDASGPTYSAAPIGALHGTLEGLGHTISNLMVSTSSTYAGLVGYSTGVIRDVGLVSGTISGDQYVGGLVGYNGAGGTISNAYAMDGVNATGDNVGGLVGYNASGGAIANAFAIGAVQSTGSYVGGLVGYNKFGGTISSAYATGAVNGGIDVGGLVGVNDGSITNAYASGAASAAGGQAGGLVGYNSINGQINDAYATGMPSGTSNVGGLVGYFASGGAISYGYYDSSTTGQLNGVQSDGSVGLATQEWLTKGPIAKGVFDTTNIWLAGYPYPVLKALPYVLIGANGSQTYGDATPTISIAAIKDQNGDDATSLVNTSGVSWLSTASAISAVAGGPYIIGGAGANIRNGYQLTYSGTLTVMKAPLWVTAKDATKTYDGLPYSGGNGVTYSAFVNGESAAALSGTLGYGGTSQGAANVGSYIITPGGLIASNYAISYANGALTILPQASRSSDAPDRTLETISTGQILSTISQRPETKIDFAIKPAVNKKALTEPTAPEQAKKKKKLDKNSDKKPAVAKKGRLKESGSSSGSYGAKLGSSNYGGPSNPMLPGQPSEPMKQGNTSFKGLAAPGLVPRNGKQKTGISSNPMLPGQPSEPMKQGNTSFKGLAAPGLVPRNGKQKTGIPSNPMLPGQPSEPMKQGNTSFKGLAAPGLVPRNGKQKTGIPSNPMLPGQPSEPMKQGNTSFKGLAAPGLVPRNGKQKTGIPSNPMLPGQPSEPMKQGNTSFKGLAAPGLVPRNGKQKTGIPSNPMLPGQPSEPMKQGNTSFKGLAAPGLVPRNGKQKTGIPSNPMLPGQPSEPMKQGNTSFKGLAAPGLVPRNGKQKTGIPSNPMLPGQPSEPMKQGNTSFKGLAAPGLVPRNGKQKTGIPSNPMLPGQPSEPMKQGNTSFKGLAAPGLVPRNGKQKTGIPSNPMLPGQPSEPMKQGNTSFKGLAAPGLVPRNGKQKTGIPSNPMLPGQLSEPMKQGNTSFKGLAAPGLVPRNGKQKTGIPSNPMLPGQPSEPMKQGNTSFKGLAAPGLVPRNGKQKTGIPSNPMLPGQPSEPMKQGNTSFKGLAAPGLVPRNGKQKTGIPSNPMLPGQLSEPMKQGNTSFKGAAGLGLVPLDQPSSPAK